MPQTTRLPHDPGSTLGPGRDGIVEPLRGQLEPWLGRGDSGPLSEEATFLEHRAALEATVLASARDELVLELDSGVLRRPT